MDTITAHCPTSDHFYTGNGQPIVGGNWPDDTTVIGVSVIANTVTLSANATATGICIATVGGAVMMETLQENQL